ncbi:MAG TPA: DUF4359 domain-containing protein [Crinalium sp.]|jgi:hypothetical protein
MKGVKVGAYLLGAAVLGVGGAMALTNPGPSAYEEFATQQLTAYLKTNTCSQAPRVLGNFLGDECARLLDKNQDEIQKFISQNTGRQNYVVFSIYQTNLEVRDFGPVLPSYHFETVGVFNTFHIYKAVKQ